MNVQNLPSEFYNSAVHLRHAKSPAERNALRAELMDRFGLSKSRLSRWLIGMGIRERQRGDKGVRRGVVTDQELEDVWKVQCSSHTLDRGLLMTDEVAIDIAVGNRLIRPDVLTIDVYRSWKRAKGYTRREMAKPEKHINTRTLGPNHAFEVDFSMARNWKLKNNKLLYDDTAYKGKDLRIDELRLLRFVLTDHYSGCRFVCYFPARGENTQIFLEGLYYAMAEKRLSNGESISDKFPFRGVPKILKMDRGSFSRSKVSRSLLERLGVQVIISQEARGKGQVEGFMWPWERNLEATFRCHPIRSAAELNDHALERCAWWNAEKTHSRHGRSPRALWLQKINTNEHSTLRELSCDLDTFKSIALTEPETRQVKGNLTISYKGKSYRVPEDLHYERVVTVQYSIFDYPKIMLRAADTQDAVSYFAEPVELDEAGFPVDSPVIGEEFKSQKKTAGYKAVEAAKKVANGYAPGVELVARGRDLEKVTATAMKPRGEDVEIEAPAAAVHSRMRAVTIVHDELGRPITRPERRYLDDAFGDQVTEEEIRSAIAAIDSGIQAEVVALQR